MPSGGAVSGFGFWVSGSGFQVSGLGSGSGVRVCLLVAGVEQLRVVQCVQDVHLDLSVATPALVPANIYN